MPKDRERDWAIGEMADGSFCVMTVEEVCKWKAERDLFDRASDKLFIEGKDVADLSEEMVLVLGKFLKPEKENPIADDTLDLNSLSSEELNEIITAIGGEDDDAEA
jgi:hypothetical protein